ncbi:hypothetical protein CSC62_14135 [Pseudoxanthomonas jiangsuensis]|uniref:LamG domain-containing protein n=1 Tax=Pseudoxanthomonas jiangsuensis TaxID=619688 RepID=UPI00139072EA|nr:LamG domain-containing protein [Pseudoxanthomonas jiangsuensis]KAF1692769.1 hypothetical protein CSC62_14135 [Pseudoxanthomonas jiangsuensis]
MTTYVALIKAEDALGRVATRAVSITVNPAGGVKALLHFDGSNGSSTVLDDTGRTWGGSAVLSTAQSVFGGASLRTNGTVRSTAASDDWAFGTGDFTIECFARIDALPSSPYYVSPVGNWSSSNGWCIFVGPAGSLHLNTNGTSLGSSTGLIAANTWYHIAVTRQAGVLRLFLNGALVASGTNTQNLARTNGPNIGCNLVTSTDYWRGYIDEVRIAKGVALYTAPFTTPSGPHSL